MIFQALDDELTQSIVTFFRNCASFLHGKPKSKVYQCIYPSSSWISRRVGHWRTALWDSKMADPKKKRAMSSSFLQDNGKLIYWQHWTVVLMRRYDFILRKNICFVLNICFRNPEQTGELLHSQEEFEFRLRNTLFLFGKRSWFLFFDYLSIINRYTKSDHWSQSSSRFPSLVFNALFHRT